MAASKKKLLPTPVEPRTCMCVRRIWGVRNMGREEARSDPINRPAAGIILLRSTFLPQYDAASLDRFQVGVGSGESQWLSTSLLLENACVNFELSVFLLVQVIHELQVLALLVRTQ